ncbi:hypothetical protein DPEC_G00170240 [Dallia pectoralis]|uniref:Uncharacterized protein n=1 Tax=Dallia pectoralis TaxID=75939 RepID=A0ACC2GD17_DALPE|nr:hypothetical protein DPEC_G00170240 [Dallia pectoralis]
MSVRMANRRGQRPVQRRAAGGQTHGRQPKHPDLQDTYLLRGKPSPPLNDLLHSTTWWSERDEQQRVSTSSLREQLVDKEQHVARLQNALRREREKSSSLQSRYSQQGVELRHREQQTARLRERLIERQRERGASMELLNPLKRDQPAGLVRTNGRKEEAALRAMLERREAELREAMKLRHKLATLLHALRAEMERSLLDTVDEGPGDKTLVQSEQSLGDHVTGGVVQAWRKVQRRLGDLLTCDAASVGTDQEKLLAQLQAELVQSQQLVREQQQLLHDSVVTALPDSLTDCYFLEDWERLQAQRAELELQRYSFQRERRAFTDAAIRLGQERLEFDQQRASVIKQQYLSDFALGWTTEHHNGGESTSLSLSGSDHMILSGCPLRPSSTGAGVTHWSESLGSQQGRFGVHSPGTPDLYSAIRLPCDSSGVDGQSQTWHEHAACCRGPARLLWSSP